MYPCPVAEGKKSVLQPLSYKYNFVLVTWALQLRGHVQTRKAPHTPRETGLMLAPIEEKPAHHGSRKRAFAQLKRRMYHQRRACL